MSKKTVWWVGIIAVCVLALGYALMHAAEWRAKLDAKPASAGVVALAACLAEKNVTMYGAYWCPHCQRQKTLFGDAFKTVPYVECTEESAKCSAAGIQGYPTWVFPDGSRIEGEASLGELASKAGCPAPER